MPTVKDLGVTVDCDATFQSHIDAVVRKGSQQAGWILRVFRTREAYAMLVLYRALVLPHLEYCCQLWTPITIGKIRRLEAIQRSYTSKFHSIGSSNYWQRLKSLRLYSLERRRERYLIVYTYKIMQNIHPNFSNEKFQIKTHVSDRRGRTCVIPPINTRSAASVASLVEASFPIRGPRLFNVLPMEIRNCNGSVETFKSKLDKFLAKIPDQPCLPGYQ